MKPRVVRLARIGLAAYVALVLYLCFARFDNMPSVPMDMFGIPLDKVAHFLMFFPYPFLFCTAFYRADGTAGRSFRVLVAGLASGLLLALLTELGQGLTDYRSKDFWDFIADSAALACSFLTALVIGLVHKKRMS